MDTVLPVLPELPPRPAHATGAGAEGVTPAAPVEIHTLLQQHHSGSVFTEPAVPQHPVVASWVPASDPQAEIESSSVHRRPPLAPRALPQPSAVLRLELRRPDL